MDEVKGLSLIVTFVDRKVGKKVIKLFNKMGCKYHTSFIYYINRTRICY